MSRALRRRDAAQYLGIGLTLFHELINTGQLPPGVPLTGTLKVWPVDELDDLIERRKRVARGDHDALERMEG